MSDYTRTGREQQPGDQPRTELHRDAAETHGYAAVLKLYGEHDLSTAVDIQDTLDSIRGNVLVDLCECFFIDSTVISVLIRDYQARARAGHDLELFAPPENAAPARALEITGMCDALVIHSSQPQLPPGFAATS